MGVLTAWPESLYLGYRPNSLSAAQGFSIDVARAMGWAAQLAYEVDDPDKVGRVLAAWGWRLRGVFAGQLAPLPLTGARGFVADAEGICVLAFAGTEPTRIADWLMDLAIHPTAEGLHSGFAAGVRAAWDSVSALLGDSGTLLATGHSLGGALAMAASLRLAPDRLAGIHTFGAPRIGHETFAALYRAAGLAERTYRLVYGADIVPATPPAEAPFGYRHVGRSLLCEAGDRFDPALLVQDTPEPPPDGGFDMRTFMQAVLRTAPPLGRPAFPGDPAVALVIDRLPPALRDHVPDRYLQALGVL